MKIKVKFLLVLLSIFFSSLVFSASVQVTSPKGGEFWVIGSQKAITWSKNGNFTKFRIYIFKDGQRLGFIKTIKNTDKTSYLWTVGDYDKGKLAVAGGYKIQVLGVTSSGKIRDKSDSTFTIIEKKESPKKEKFERSRIIKQLQAEKRKIKATAVFLKPLIYKALGVSKTGLHATPGGRVAIKGKYLGKERGEIRIYINARSIPLLNVKWESSTNVVGTVPKLTGVKDEMAEVRVFTKNGGRSNSIKIPFYATRSTVTLKWDDPVVKLKQCGRGAHANGCSPVRIKWWGTKGTFCGYHRVLGGPAGTIHGTGRGDDVFTIKLKNGWIVDEGRGGWGYLWQSSTDEKVKGPYWSNPVKSGSGFIWEARFRWVVSEGDTLIYQYVAKIKGPIGVPYK